ncbi:MAG: PEP-CTERM sorting domain-containing protein, partial [Pirellulales bacterium]|nr:PEP-CTERM sorting domain-containing protein [Pirellulales bacterium]
VDVADMPDGLTFHINYLANAVQLQVVNTPFFSADFDDDGDVDATDLSIWRGAFDLNQLGDADGDNDSDGNDFLLWQRQLGSAAVGSAAAAVPEPTTLLLSLLALAALAQRRT